MITAFRNEQIHVRVEIGREAVAIVNGIIYDDLLTACVFDRLPCGHTRVWVIVCGAELYEGFDREHRE